MSALIKFLRISYRKDALKFKLKRLSQSFACIVAASLRAAKASVLLRARRAGLQKSLPHSPRIYRKRPLGGILASVRAACRALTQGRLMRRDQTRAVAKLR